MEFFFIKYYRYYIGWLNLQQMLNHSNSTELNQYNSSSTFNWSNSISPLMHMPMKFDSLAMHSQSHTSNRFDTGASFLQLWNALCKLQMYIFSEVHQNIRMVIVGENGEKKKLQACIISWMKIVFTMVHVLSQHTPFVYINYVFYCTIMFYFDSLSSVEYSGVFVIT